MAGKAKPKKTVALFGGSFNPPGLHHRGIAERLIRHFDEVLVIPCGPRPDKQATNDVDPIYRAVMTDIAFRGLPRVAVELFDLEQATFTRTHQLQDMFAHRGELWHVVGTDLIQGGHKGRSYIQRFWQKGREIWERLNFAVIVRPGYHFNQADLPPHHHVIEFDCDGSSRSIRERLFRHQSITAMVTPEVEQYIDLHGLYRGSIPARVARFTLEQPRLLIIADERNPKAVELAKKFKPFRNAKNPNCVLVLGGDGSMLRAIRKHWRLRLPFLGINAGHIGFLMNDAEEIHREPLFPLDLILHQMPLIYLEMTDPKGQPHQALAFNDAWMERAGSQTAWIEVKVNERVRLPRLVCDGALLSTAAGSTAYARAMGATPLLADTPAWVLVGSNVMRPMNWKSALLTHDSQVELRAHDVAKRPVRAYADGVAQGEVETMRARISRIAAAELAFLPTHDMAEKIAQIQFPAHP
ncbi:MAG: NAD(+)/NADH kinase [Verrucomicrobiota bacterium]